jgi:hypothetical protein
MTTTASTKRSPAMSSGKVAAAATNLTSLLITPVMLSKMTGQYAIRQAIGLEGTMVQVFEVYTEKHIHTDSGVSVDQVPDIEVGDKLVVGSITYEVRWAESHSPASSFGATLQLYVIEEKS